MNKNFSSFISGLGICWSMTNINETISTILLILSIANILWNMGYSIAQKIKNKKYDEISSEINKAQEELEKLQYKKQEDDNNANL